MSPFLSCWKWVIKRIDFQARKQLKPFKGDPKWLQLFLIAVLVVVYMLQTNLSQYLIDKVLIHLYTSFSLSFLILCPYP